MREVLREAWLLPSLPHHTSRPWHQRPRRGAPPKGSPVNPLEGIKCQEQQKMCKMLHFPGVPSTLGGPREETFCLIIVAGHLLCLPAKRRASTPRWGRVALFGAGGPSDPPLPGRFWPPLHASHAAPVRASRITSGGPCGPTSPLHDAKDGEAPPRTSEPRCPVKGTPRPAQGGALGPPLENLPPLCTLATAGERVPGELRQDRLVALPLPRLTEETASL